MCVTVWLPWLWACGEPVWMHVVWSARWHVSVDNPNALTLLLLKFKTTAQSCLYADCSLAIHFAAMFAYILIAAAAALSAAAPSRPSVPFAFSANINLTAATSDGTFWNYYAGYYAPGRVSTCGPSSCRVFARAHGSHAPDLFAFWYNST